MFMRLAFAVAVHTDCDIFLMDEMLAVGDQPFRRKCMKKIYELKDQGKTMVYVSHNPNQVVKLCEHGHGALAGSDGVLRRGQRGREVPRLRLRGRRETTEPAPGSARPSGCR